MGSDGSMGLMGFKDDPEVEKMFMAVTPLLLKLPI